MENRIVKTLEQHSPEITSAVLAYVKDAGKWDLYHLNPYDLAEKIQVDADQLIRWFLHAVNAGAFDLVWNTLCPHCGANEHQHGSLNSIGTEFYCYPCDRGLTGELDDKVEVVFQPRAIIKDLTYDPFLNEESFKQFYFSANFRPSTVLSETLEQLNLGFWFAPAGQTKQISVHCEEGTYRFVSLNHHTQTYVKSTHNGPDEVTINLSDTGNLPENIEIGTGKVTFNIANQHEQTAGLNFIQSAGEEQKRKIKDSNSRFKRFLSGKEVLNLQLFRELFAIQDLPSDLNLRVGDVTLLFTDLKGSTALYEDTGDIEAFRLVKDHFALLTQAVSQHRGAVVKTIGDAVMAAFSHPSDGIKAALQMLKLISEYNLTSRSQVGLKLGLHQGPALAVNANQSLDYFGRTVNIAARIQGQADAGEIWFSEAISNNSEISGLLRDAKFTTESHSVVLRGIENEVSLLKAFVA